MSVDPRSPIVQVMARLGRETQLHLDERHRHFKITDKVILFISLLLVILAFVNVYYVTVLYRDLDGIVDNMDYIYRNIDRVSDDMDLIAGRVNRFERHMQSMAPITANMQGISQEMPSVSENMDQLNADITNQCRAASYVAGFASVFCVRLRISMAMGASPARNGWAAMRSSMRSTPTTMVV